MKHEAFYQYYFRLYKINCLHTTIKIKSFNMILKETKNITYCRYDKITGEPYLIIPKKEQRKHNFRTIYI